MSNGADDTRASDGFALGRPDALILIVGQQGTGKTTLGHRLEHELGGKFYSGGALIRAEIDLRTPRGLEMKEPIERGESISPDWAYDLLAQALASCKRAPLILDGYPHTADEADRVGLICGAVPDQVLLLEVHDHALLVHRIRNRVECARCYATFGPDALPVRAHTCTWCGGPLRQRSEDEDGTSIARRHDFWRQHGPAIVRRYESAGLLSRIRADRAPRTVLDRALSIIGGVVAQKARN